VSIRPVLVWLTRWTLVLAMSTLMSFGGPATAESTCPPTKDNLHTYNYQSFVSITNHGGAYDSGASFSYDYSRRCQVSPITKILVRDNFGVVEYASSLYGRFDYTYKDLSVSNCWEVARVSSFGQSDWSNKVCYTAPVIQPVSISGIHMYLNAKGKLDGDVYINWTKGFDSASLHWTTCPPSETSQSSEQNWTYDQSAFGSEGQTVFTGHVSRGPRCILVYAKNTNGVLSMPVRVEYTYARRMAQAYSRSPNYGSPNLSGGGSSNSSWSSNECVGICYGVPSKVNGLPRNKYVSGYFRKDGTYVQPYTRSK